MGTHTVHRRMGTRLLPQTTLIASTLKMVSLSCLSDRFNSRVRARSPDAAGAGWTDSSLPLSSLGSEETGYQNIVYDHELLLPSHKYVGSHRDVTVVMIVLWGTHVTMVMMVLGEGHMLLWCL